jgi:parvulin-like peptidyl-prolyl cis-trans isomerase-like protein
VRNRQLFREPLLHFLLIGVVLFAAFGKLAGPDTTGKRIVVSQAMVDQMAQEFQARWLRTPGDEELSGLIDSYVQDEILYRHGLSLGLDRDDPVIKRRVRQKLELMSEEQNAQAAPTDADLAAYMQKNPAPFLRPATVSFEQVLLEAPGDQAAVARAVAAAHAALARGADPRKLGRASMLPARVDNASRDDVARDFGTAFATTLTTLPLSAWSGPVASGFGTHLVRVTARTPAVLPPLNEVRPLVAREWENARRTASRDENYQKLRRNYDVVIEAKRPAALARP